MATECNSRSGGRRKMGMNWRGRGEERRKKRREGNGKERWKKVFTLLIQQKGAEDDQPIHQNIPSLPISPPPAGPNDSCNNSK